MITDVHSHLNDSMFDKDREEVLKRAIKAGVKQIFVAGVNHKTNKEILELAQQYKDYKIIKPTLGRYPEGCLEEEYYGPNETTVEEDCVFIKKHAKEIVGIGEIGLDLHTGTHESLPEQIRVFKAMIELGIELDKPLIIHSRKAEREVIDVLAEYEGKLSPQKVVLHCFSGKKKIVEEAIAKKYLFSIPPIVKRSEQFQLLVKLAPLAQLLTETDAPYLSPYKNEDKSFHRNEPAYCKESIKTIAEIKRMEEEELERQLHMNVQRLLL